MREIKFRVWNGETMISPDFITKDGFAFWKEDSILCYAKPDKVMEYTGLKDKNGKEIYEGDRVKNKNGVEGVVRYMEKITYDSGGALHPGFYCEEWLDQDDLNYYNGFESCEITGNVYENPELLK